MPNKPDAEVERLADEIENPFNGHAQALFFRYCGDYAELTITALKAGFPQPKDPLTQVHTAGYQSGINKFADELIIDEEQFDFDKTTQGHNTAVALMRERLLGKIK